jgi:hypothetical protein
MVRINTVMVRSETKLWTRYKVGTYYIMKVYRRHRDKYPCITGLDAIKKSEELN